MEDVFTKPEAFKASWRGRCVICQHESQLPPAKNGDPHSGAQPCLDCIAKFKANWRYCDGSPEPVQSFATIIPEPTVAPITQIFDAYSYIIHCCDSPPHSGVAQQDPLGMARLLGGGPRPVCNYALGPVTIFRSHLLERFSIFSPVYVLDCAHLPYSGTMKDVRSAGILYWSLLWDYDRLVLWTAGNAGLTLARLVYAFNRIRHSPDLPARHVYSMVYADSPRELITVLRAFGCRVAPIATRGAILTRKQTIDMAQAFGPVRMKDEREGRFVEVSDGWDGIGAFMYRMLVYQALTHTETHRVAESLRAIRYVIAPVGTANLLLGAFLGTKDFAEKNADHEVQVVGVLADDPDNIVSAIEARGRQKALQLGSTSSEAHPRRLRATKRGALEGKSPLAPKLTGVYSPLAPWIAHHMERGQRVTALWDKPEEIPVAFVKVDQAQQVVAGANLLSRMAELGTAAEPSALVALGAVQPIAETLLKAKADGHNEVPKPDECGVLVINSGFGILGSEELKFYADSLLQFG